MKLIDVLVMISKEELKEGTKIKDLHSDATWILRIKNGHGLIVDEENKYYLDVVYSINNEVELIEPECKHEWEQYGIYNTKTNEDKHFRKCVKYGLVEEIEPTDNATEKIKELDVKSLSDIFIANDDFNKMVAFSTTLHKLNEVIRYINRRSENE